jgi:hypothetical protein
MRLKDFLPELTQRMTKDLYQAVLTIDVQYVLTDYLEILHFVNEIYDLPDLEAETQTVKAIRTFLQGHETREELKDKLMAILEDYKEKEV